MATVKRISFEVTGADGGPLRGEVRTASPGASRPAVVIAHGFKGFKDWGMFPHLAGRIAQAGMAAVSFNFSGSGVGEDGQSFSEPERFAHDTYTRQLFDLSEILRRMVEARLVPEMAPPSKIGLLGHSRGGGMAVLAAAERTDIAALVTWAAIAKTRRWSAEEIRRWRKDGKLDVVNTRTGEVLPLMTDILDDLDRDTAGRLDIGKAAARVKAPWLIVHGEADEGVSVENARELELASGGHARLVIIPGAGHTFGARHPWQGSTPELDRAMDVTLDWLVRELL